MAYVLCSYQRKGENGTKKVPSAFLLPKAFHSPFFSHRAFQTKPETFQKGG